MNRQVEFSNIASFKCSNCGYTATIPERKLPEGKTRFGAICPKCKATTVVDLARGKSESAPAGNPDRTVSDLQQRINESQHETVLVLRPGEFIGQVTIDRPIIMEGQGKKTWVGALTGPVVKITSKGVVLRNLMIEAGGAPDDVAVEAVPGANPILENLIIRGAVIGIPAENVRNHQMSGQSLGITINKSLGSSDSPDEDTIRIYHLEDDLALSPSDSLVDKRITELFGRASRSEKAHDWKTAIECYQDIIGLFPGHPDAERLLQRVRVKSAIAGPIPVSGASAPPQGQSPLPAQPQASPPKPGLAPNFWPAKKGAYGLSNLAIITSSDLRTGSLDGCATGCLTWILISVGILGMTVVLGNFVEALTNLTARRFATILGVGALVAMIVVRLLIARKRRVNTP